jgi:hypothetical protein
MALNRPFRWFAARAVNPLEYADRGEDNRLLQRTLEELNAAVGLAFDEPARGGRARAPELRTAWVRDFVDRRGSFVSGFVLTGVEAAGGGGAAAAGAPRLWRFTQNGPGPARGGQTAY